MFIQAAYPVCFVSGTRICCAHDNVEIDVTIERLRIGDMVVTASGEHRPIRWLGHRTVDCHRAAHPHLVLPVRIAADAFGPGRPARDLYVSPGYAIAVDVCGEVLIPASALVNGATITQVEVDEVTYWHVELDSHDLLLAEGLPAESYMDAGNRTFFAESGTVALAASPDAAPADKRLGAYCRPFVDIGTPDSDALIAVVRERMHARAEAQGWRRDADPLAGLHLVADGVRLEPHGAYPRVRFVVPATAKDVRLISAATAPRDADPRADARRLGVCLAAATVSDGLDVQRTLDLASWPAKDGFHEMEADCRWTTGSARLPTSLWDGCQGAFFLTVDLAHIAPPRWQAPRDNVVTMRKRA